MRIALALLMLASTTLSLEMVRKIVQDEFADQFRLNSSRRNQNISPPFVTGDFDGDGKMDLATLASIWPEEVNRRLAIDSRLSLPRVTISKTLGKGTSTADAKSAQLNLSELAQNFRESILLLIVHDFARTGGASVRFALLDFCNNGEIKMTASRPPLRTATAGDSRRIAPPRLKGDALLFLDGKGEGTAVYWDGTRYLWYPVE
jgi:hypothetical protein